MERQLLRAVILCVLGILVVCAAAATEAQTRDRLSRIDRIDRMDRATRTAPVTRSLDRQIQRRQVMPSVQDPQPHADSLLDDQRLVRARDGFAVRRGEILALNLSDAARAAAANAGMSIVTEMQIGADMRLARIGAPAPVDLGAMLDLLRAADPEGVFDFNHAFAASGPIPQLVPAPPVQRTGGPALKVGMIDGGVLASHPDLEAASIQQQAFPEGASVTASDHGTAVAGRLAEALNAPFSLMVADVLGEAQASWAGADAIASGLAWLSDNDVRVANISLAGPPNAIIERMVKRYLAQGGALVAAVGNGGPFSNLIYPAAYPDVVGVTAVDRTGRVYPLATTGAHVDRSALGVDVPIATLAGRAISSGTSWAAPVIAAEMARGAVSPTPFLTAAP